MYVLSECMKYVVKAHTKKMPIDSYAILFGDEENTLFGAVIGFVDAVYP